MKLISNSPEETRQLGLTFAEALKIPAVVGFFGELGAGKTELVRSIIQGLGVVDSVSSPTYVIEQQYQMKQGYISHWDLYRLSSEEIYLEIAEIQLSAEALVFIEWPSKGLRVSELLDISVSIKGEGNKREIEFSAKSELGDDVLKKLVFTLK